jgi:thiosulfate/3-mercaptopyruvate sulfurtransferase
MMDKRILIVADSLRAMLDDPGLVVVDCRFELGNPSAGRTSYERGHIPSAVFLDLDEDLAGPVGPDTGRHPLPDVDVISTTLSQLGVSTSSRIVVYDGNNGALAARAWWLMRWLGLEDVRVLDGGFDQWRRLGLPIARDGAGRSAGQFEARVRNDLVLTTPEIEACLDKMPTLRLVDVRDSQRFRGEVEPIDPVAGHIPGALSLPYTAFVHADGTWKPLAERSGLLEGLLGTDRSVAWSAMCGSGVTACHLAISGLEAGFREPRIYVGSWSEWIRDTGRPIGLGDA